MQGAGSLENTMVLGKIEGKRRRGQWRMKWLDGIQWLNGYEFEQTPGDSEGLPGLLPSMGSQKVGHDLVTEQQQGSMDAHDSVAF